MSDSSFSPPRAARATQLIVVSVWIGLLAGLLEVGGVALAHLRWPIMEMSRDFLWMIPLALVMLTTASGLAMAVLSVFWKSPRLVAITIFFALLIVTLELLLYIPRLHDVAVLALSLGVAVQGTRLLLPRWEPIARLAYRTAPWLAAAVVLLGGGARAIRTLGERRSLAALPAAEQKPNIILVTWDAVRAAELSLYGYSRETSPNLDRLASMGATFERAISTAPWTLPSHASILTGRWHHELSTDFDSPLDAEYPTLAEVLKSRGYATGAVVANLRYCGYETGLDRGFIHYHDYPVTFRQLLASSRLLRKVLNNFRLRRLIENDQHLSRKSAEMVNEAALSWLGSVGEHPYFLFLNYFDAHEPYLPPPPFDTLFGPGRQHGRLSPLHRWLWEPAMGHANMGPPERQEEIDAYDGSIAHIDAEFGALLDSLRGRGLLDNTMIIVTADHGEEFAEHRVYEHGYSLYRAGVEVPLVIVAPGIVPQGIRVPGPVSLREIPTTVLDLLDMRTADPFPGFSLAEEWRPEAPGPHTEPILSQVNQVTGHPDWFPVSQGTLRSVTYRGLRYIRTDDSAEELFDFDRDTAERHNLIGQAAYDSAVTDLRAIVDGMVRSTDGDSK